MDTASPHDPIYIDLLRPDGIRLLELYPGPAKEIPLMGSLILTTLSACEDDLVNPYTALSYVWGDPELTDTITLAGGSIKLGITANLSAALKDIRHKSEVMTVWVDAICINQANILERNQQVSIMRDIYNYAGSTIIYLGSPSPGASLIFETAVQKKRERLEGMYNPEHECGDGGAGTRVVVAENKKRVPKARKNFGKSAFDPARRELEKPKETVESDAERRLRYEARKNFRKTAFDPISREFEEPKEIVESDAQKRFRHAVEMDLCSYPWFSRGWIFQELVVSKDPRIQCGKLRLRWDDLMAVVEPFLAKTDPTRHLRALHEVRSKGLHGDNRNMYKLIMARTGAHVTDPRDMFFSLVGLASDHEEVSKFLVPDYGKSSRGVYIAAARYMLDRAALRWFLLEARPWAARRISLPSWVPEWEIQTPHRNETEPMTTPRNALDEVLVVKELHCFGVVERVTDVFPHEPGSPSSVWRQAAMLGRGSNWDTDWEKFIGPVANTVYPAGDDFGIPDWPHGRLMQIRFQGLLEFSLDPDTYLPPCRLALVVNHRPMNRRGLWIHSHLSVLVPANVAPGDYCIAFQRLLHNPLFNVWPPPDKEWCYGFRRSLEKTFDATISEYGVMTHHEFLGLYPSSFSGWGMNSETGVIMALH